MDIPAAVPGIFDQLLIEYRPVARGALKIRNLEKAIRDLTLIESFSAVSRDDNPDAGLSKTEENFNIKTQRQELYFDGEGLLE